MKTKVIFMFPQYTGIFLNKNAKRNLLSCDDDNILKPMHNKRFGHHITINFQPGKSPDIKWGAKVDLHVTRHIHDAYCQIIEVTPIEMIYKDGNNSTVVTDPTEMCTLLGTNERRFYITISAQREGENGERITHEYSEKLLNMSKNECDINHVTNTDISTQKIVLSGFCGMHGDAIVENIRRRVK